MPDATTLPKFRHWLERHELTRALFDDVAPPRSTRFGSPLVLGRVHWVRPELVAEVKYLTWTADNLLRQVVYEGLREDKPAAEVQRDLPHPKVESAALPSKKPSRRERPV